MQPDTHPHDHDPSLPDAEVATLRAWMDRHIPTRARRAFLLSLLLFGSVGCYAVTARYLLRLVVITGDSMVPYLRDGERRILHTWILRTRPLERGDVVALRDPLDGGLSVKRIAGKPGEEVLLHGGKVWVNGKPLEETYLPDGLRTEIHRRGSGRYLLGEREYFLLGDNREHSLDSRMYGPVVEGEILGLVQP